MHRIQIGVPLDLSALLIKGRKSELRSFRQAGDEQTKQGETDEDFQ
jgi:hypothetical protein